MWYDLRLIIPKFLPNDERASESSSDSRHLNIQTNAI